jgi:NAD(P)H dehydrogenase (quinone)
MEHKEIAMTIAVTGATGQLGRLAVEALKARGAKPVALARSPGKAADLGVEVRGFDYTAPDAAALKGVETLVLISSNDFNDRAGQHKAVIAAAKAAGVGHVIYTSILKGAQSPMLLAADHIETEAALKASGLGHTILRNGWYTENYTGSLGAAVAHGAMAGAAGEGLVSTATRADYAEAIAVVALDPAHQGKVHELAGDRAYRLADMAAEVSRLSGKAVGYASLPEGDYAAMLMGFGLPEGFAKVLADSDAQAAQGALFDDSGSLGRLIGRPTTPMEVSVKAALG